MEATEYPITALGDSRNESHAGGCFTPDGNILLSFRNVSTVFAINPSTGATRWRPGAPPLRGRHAPDIAAKAPEIARAQAA